MGAGGGRKRKYSRGVPHGIYSGPVDKGLFDECDTLVFDTKVMKPTLALSTARVGAILLVNTASNEEVILVNSGGEYCGSIISPHVQIQRLISCMKRGKEYQARILVSGPPCEVRITARTK